MKNGFLPIRLSTEVSASLRKSLAEGQGGEIAIDLAAGTVTGPNGAEHSFEISAFHKHCLLNGLDDIGLTLEKAAAIDSFEAKNAALRPWA